MKRAAVLVVAAAAVLLAAWPAARGEAKGGVCAQMTPAKLLQHPAIAEGYADALGSGDAAEVARVEDMLRQIRTAHGCDGDVALPAVPPATPALPHGHPPIRVPPIDEGRRAPALFSDPGPVTI